MEFSEALNTFPLILTECAITERLRYHSGIQLHPTLFITPLLYDAYGRQKLKEIYLEYRQTALEARLPILLCAPTWRVDRKRITEGGFSTGIITEAVQFIREIGSDTQRADSPFYTGGLLAPKNDCYSAEEALSVEEAVEYHSFQVDLLERSKVDVIVAQTVPAVSEACGIAEAISEASSTPYLISFVINRYGKVLDSTPLSQAIKMVDAHVARPPLGYMVNCVHPTFLSPDQNPRLFERLIGIQANSSSLDHEQLDGSKELHQDSLEEWGQKMIALNRLFGVKILGGCCGTDNSYLRYIADNHGLAI